MKDIADNLWWIALWLFFLMFQSCLIDANLSSINHKLGQLVKTEQNK